MMYDENHFNISYLLGKEKSKVFQSVFLPLKRIHFSIMFNRMKIDIDHWLMVLPHGLILVYMD